jgi:hypothetical protein
MYPALLKKLVKEPGLLQSMPLLLAMQLVKSIEVKEKDNEILPNSR